LVTRTFFRGIPNRTSEVIGPIVPDRERRRPICEPLTWTARTCDITTTEEDGHIVQIDGFFGAFPALDA